MKKFTGLFYSIILLVLAAAAISFVLATPILPTLAICGLISAFAPMPKGTVNGVVLEQWTAYIIERFWKDNAFLKNAYSDDDYVVKGRIVHIPQPGSKPLVQKNRNVFPAVAVRRSDTDVTYTLDEYTTDPTHIPNIDAIHLSYSKQDSVLGDHMSVLNEVVADDMLLKWASNATFFKTTGGDTATTGTSPAGAQIAPITGQTGNRLGFHHKDLKKLMIQFNVANIPKDDNRFVMIDDNMYEFFYDSLSDNQSKDFSRYANAETGVIGKLHGFNIGSRSSILNSSNADAVKALGSSLAATDNLCSLAWHKNTVARAIGTTSLFQDMNNPLYYGDVHSCLVMAGGRVRRADGLGVYIIAQGTPRP